MSYQKPSDSNSKRNLSSSQRRTNYDGDTAESNRRMLHAIGISTDDIRRILFFLCFLNALINFDHGAIPAALKRIASDLKIGEGKLGGLGSCVFFGLVVGALAASYLFYLMEYKTIIIGSLLINSLSLYMLTAFSDHYALMCLSRFFAGFSQISISLYIPLFIDTFIEREQKAKYMPMATLSAIIGTIVGYGLTSVIINMEGGSW